MVAIFSLDIPNFYIGGAVGGVFIIFLIWFLLRSKGGRLGEEKEEERETNVLKNEEKIVEAVEEDEKKQCTILDKLFSNIMINLGNSGNNALAEEVLWRRERISVLLTREMREKMSVKDALETFKELHPLIDYFLAKLPNNNQQINTLAEEIKKHQQSYYQDLIKELEMDEIKKKQLRKLWSQFLDEENGSVAA